jgi:hypothetical protein
MANLTYNSQEFIKSQIAIDQDLSYAKISSTDICNESDDLDTQNSAWDEAVEYVTEHIYKGIECEIEDDGNNGAILYVYLKERATLEDGTIEA